jgi:hypothetical protein
VRYGAAGSHRGSNDRRLGSHCVGRTFLTSALNVQLDTLWTLRRQGHGDCDELLMDSADRAGCKRRFIESPKRFHGVRSVLIKALQFRELRAVIYCSLREELEAFESGRLLGTENRLLVEV